MSQAVGVKVDRLDAIRSHLYANGFSTIQALADAVGASLATIRRDLQILEREGAIDRVHGGARIAEGSSVEVAFQEREKRNLSAKRAIATAAYDLLHPRTAIFLDAGTTVLQLARLIRINPLPLRIFTNGLTVAQEFLNISESGSGAARRSAAQRERLARRTAGRGDAGNALVRPAVPRRQRHRPRRRDLQRGQRRGEPQPLHAGAVGAIASSWPIPRNSEPWRPTGSRRWTSRTRHHRCRACRRIGVAGSPNFGVEATIADLRAQAVSDELILGIDGGGSKVLVALADRRGRILRTSRGGGVNPMDNPNWQQELRAASRCPFAMKRDLPAVAAALPAYGEVERISRPAARGDRRACSGNVHRRVLNDVDAAHLGAFAGGPGILILSGTGLDGMGARRRRPVLPRRRLGRRHRRRGQQPLDRPARAQPRQPEPRRPRAADRARRRRCSIISASTRPIR